VTGDALVVDFFISRNKADKDWASWIAFELEEAGFTTIIQDWDFRPGSNFALGMQQGAEAERTIAVLSPEYLAAEYTQPEWAAAFAADPKGAERKLVPVRVRECDPIGLLAPIVRIDLVGKNEQDARRELLVGIKRERAKPSMPPKFPGTGPEKQPPFPGDAGAVSPRRMESPRRTRSEADIVRRIDELDWGVRPDRGRGYWTGDVWLGAVIVTERRDSPFIDVLELGSTELHEQLQRLALFGRSAVFRVTRQTRAFEREDHIALEQHDDRIQSTLEAYTDGTLVYRTVVERPTRSSTMNLADIHVIDEQAVLNAVSAFLTFARSFYAQCQLGTGNLYLGLSLSDIDWKHFGRLPEYPVSEFMVGDPRVPDPLHVPAVPMKIPPLDLDASDDIAKLAVAHIARVFRLAGAYYKPSG
jgi:hypothetical protein